MQMRAVYLAVEISKKLNSDKKQLFQQISICTEYYSIFVPLSREISL